MCSPSHTCTSNPHGFAHQDEHKAGFLIKSAAGTHNALNVSKSDGVESQVLARPLDSPAGLFLFPGR